MTPTAVRVVRKKAGRRGEVLRRKKAFVLIERKDQRMGLAEITYERRPKISKNG